MLLTPNNAPAIVYISTAARLGGYARGWQVTRRRPAVIYGHGLHSLVFHMASGAGVFRLSVPPCGRLVLSWKRLEALGLLTDFWQDLGRWVVGNVTDGETGLTLWDAQPL